MFWDMDVMRDSLKIVEEHLGPVGRYLENPEYSGIGLYTENASKFWYGDIDSEKDDDILNKIAKELKEVLYIIPDMTALNDCPITKQAVRIYSP